MTGVTVSDANSEAGKSAFASAVASKLTGVMASDVKNIVATAATRRLTGLSPGEFLRRRPLDTGISNSMRAFLLLLLLLDFLLLLLLLLLPRRGCMGCSVCCTCAGEIAPVTVRACQRTLLRTCELSRL